MDELLGDFTITKKAFPDVEKCLEAFDTEAFRNSGAFKKAEEINRKLVALIQADGSFLLDCVVDFIGKVRERGLVDRYTLSSFELWLNQYSGLSKEENAKIRGKIAGKWLPRDAYQIFFPIGMNKQYEGTHFVTAHSSPDLDTTVASFWGWVDAFAARVGDGLHIWNVPGGPPQTQVEIPLLFNEIFGKDVFECIAKTRESLTLTSLDLMTQSGIIKKKLDEYSLSVEHDRYKNAVILVDNHGYYKGDWRHFDVEGVRQVITSLNGCLRWIENDWHVELISLFAKEQLHKDDIPPFVREILNRRLCDCDPAKEFTQRQQEYLGGYLQKVLKVPSGLSSTFEEFSAAMKVCDVVDFSPLITKLKTLPESDLFDASGNICENRPRIFHYLEDLVTELSTLFRLLRKYVDRLDIALQVKTEVFGFKPQFLSHRADIEEIKSKMASYPYLTVTELEHESERKAIGVIYASALQKALLGTVTLRDFCNREEMKIPSYLEVISVIDHHKATLQTMSPPMALISDAQSANALVAELAFRVNDRYGLGGLEPDTIESQLEEVRKDLSTSSRIRVYQRLLQRLAVAKTLSSYFVDPRREFVEYLHFLYAILDDTDLLTKVSKRDIDAVAQLLNRLKSLAEKKEQEVVSFDDIPNDQSYTQEAAKRLLQNADFHSLYSKVYAQKERAIEENLTRCIKGESSSIFIDTKVLNECARVGQTKIFDRNYPKFLKYAPEIRSIWYNNALEIAKDNPTIDLHMHMISTIASADELFAGERKMYEHKDELWIWTPEGDLAAEHLLLFLNAFKERIKDLDHQMDVEFLGHNAKDLSVLFGESFLPVRHIIKEGMREKDRIPVTILHFKAGLLNSRKGMIAPYIPRLRRS